MVSERETVLTHDTFKIGYKQLKKKEEKFTFFIEIFNSTFYQGKEKNQKGIIQKSFRNITITFCVVTQSDDALHDVVHVNDDTLF